jgi:hypothetical protein
MRSLFLLPISIPNELSYCPFAESFDGFERIARLGLKEGPNALKPGDEITVTIVPATARARRATVGD